MSNHEGSYQRILVIFGVTFIISVGLLIHLIYIQIVKYPEYSKKAAVQRRVSLLDNQNRGCFLDRNGKLIRGNEESWYLIFEKMGAERFKDVASKLETVLGDNLISKYHKFERFPFWIYPKTLNDFQILAITTLDIKEIKIISNLVRQDFSSGFAWHLLGLSSKDKGFSGLESLYQPIIESKKKKSSVFVVTDGFQHYFPGLGVRSINAKHPTGIVLTIDARIQTIVEEAMDKRKMTGAVVVLDVKTGDILAMSSRPMVNLTNLNNSITDNENPFLNRAVSAYQPGSIFKLITLSAGLDTGLLTENDRFFDQGFYQIGLKNWYCTTSGGRGHGEIDLTEALAYSCNPVFIEIALRLGPELILNYADQFGLGRPCNIGLHEEAWGEIPSGIGLSEGDQANLALGQQFVYTTPLQIASLIQTIANDGVRSFPGLVLGRVDLEEHTFNKLPVRESCRVLNAKTARLIQKMMAAVVDYGTGKNAKLIISAAGKTGTAQFGNEQELVAHAWFAGFAPFEEPRYVTVVFYEKGISGGETAAPVFKEVMEKVTKLLQL